MKRQLVEGLMMEGKPLKVALEAVGMAKSSYYYRLAGWRKPRALDETLVSAINEVRQGHAGVYGYRKVTMALRAAGWTVNAKKGKPIVYGITIPSNAKSKELAREFIKLLLSDTGRNVMEVKNGQPFLEPPLCDHPENLPLAIREVLP